MERFPLDTYVCVTSIIACSVCAAMCLFSSDSSSFYMIGFALLSMSIALPFPCSSSVIQHSIDPSYQSLLFSLLAVTSNLGSVASTQLMYSFQSPSHVFGLLAQFGAACAMAFYVFYPEESKEKKEESKSVSLSPRKNETLRLSLCFLAQFLVYLTRRIISEWSSVYLPKLFPLSSEASIALFTHASTAFEIAGVSSLLLFGFVSTKQCSDRFNRSIVRYLLCSIVAIFLLLLATQLRSEKGVLVASAIIGFFLSVPYALMEMVIMRECGRFSVSRMLSVASLNTQLAGTVAGYPAGRLLQLTGFEAAPAVEAGMLGVATMCLVVVERVKGKEKGE
ncbi:hypothetical protein WA588_006204 [Blastocystis sp. NMH]